MAMVLGMVTPSEEVQQKSKGTVKRVIAYKLGEDEIDGANVNLILKFAGDEPCSLFKQSQIALIMQNTRFAMQLTGAQNGEARLRNEVIALRNEVDLLLEQRTGLNEDLLSVHRYLGHSRVLVMSSVRLLEQGNIQEARRVLLDHFTAMTRPGDVESEARRVFHGNDNDERLLSHSGR